MKVPVTVDGANVRLKVHASKRIISFLTNDWLVAASRSESRKLSKIIGQLASFTGLKGDITIFFNKEPQNKKDIELIFTSEDGKDFLLRLYDNICNDEVFCTLPGVDSNSYDKRFSVLHNGYITFFVLDLENSLIVPKFQKKYIKEEGAIVASKCVQLTDDRMCFITLELERYNSYLLYTMVVPNRDKIKKLVDAYTQNLVYSLNRVPENQTSFEYYEKTKDLLKDVCGNLTIEAYSSKEEYVESQSEDATKMQKISACKNRLVVEDYEIYSYMLYDPSRKWAITSFATHDWYVQTKYQDVKNTAGFIHQTELSIAIPEMGEFKDLKSEICPETTRFIAEKLRFAFKD